MAATSKIEAAVSRGAAVIINWAVLIGRLILGIAIIYAAAKMLSFGWISIESIRIPYPVVRAELLDVLKLAGTIWLITR